jgi:hypothetical protein
VEVPWWFKTEAKTFRDPHGLSFVFEFVADVKAHERIVDIGRGFRRHMRVRHRRMATEFSLPRTVLEQFRDEAPRIFSLTFENFLMDLSPKIYEADPRIGWSSERNEGSLPISKIFDPRGLFSRSGLPEETAPEHVRPPCCPFCRFPHLGGNPPVWAGANLMWVHPSCWGSKP